MTSLLGTGWPQRSPFERLVGRRFAPGDKPHSSAAVGRRVAAADGQGNGQAAVDRSVVHPTRDEVRAARSVAEHMAALGGPDLRNMSDAELVAHMKQMAKAMGEAFSKVGISADEASRSFQRLAEAMNKAPNAGGQRSDD